MRFRPKIHEKTLIHSELAREVHPAAVVRNGSSRCPANYGDGGNSIGDACQYARDYFKGPGQKKKRKKAKKRKEK